MFRSASFDSPDPPGAAPQLPDPRLVYSSYPYDPQPSSPLPQRDKKKRNRKHASCEGECVYKDCEPLPSHQSSSVNSEQVAQLEQRLRLANLEIARLRHVIDNPALRLPQSLSGSQRGSVLPITPATPLSPTFPVTLTFAPTHPAPSTHLVYDAPGPPTYHLATRSPEAFASPHVGQTPDVDSMLFLPATLLLPSQQLEPGEHQPGTPRPLLSFPPSLAWTGSLGARPPPPLDAHPPQLPR
ncbi:hypothetical protein JCM11641_004642 [Rhodosporidiobolus odoratus]